MRRVAQSFTGRITELGFPALEVVESLRSIAHLFRANKSRCGIYLLQFPDERIYIGQSIDVVRRFAQHRQSHDDLIGFAFIPVNRTLLNKVEIKYIHRAEALGLAVLNIINTSNIAGDADLDLVFPIAEQNAWLNEPYAYNCETNVSRVRLPQSQIARYAKRYEKLTMSHHYQTLVPLLRMYLWKALPVPELTEYSFWSVSCLPATNKSIWPRLACVSAGVMELFVLGYSRHSPNDLWGFVNLASDVLSNYFPDKGVKEAFPSVRFERSFYRDGGRYQLSAHCDDAQMLWRLFCHPGVVQAAATLALRVMRKRATIYAKYHCKQLADCVLDSRPTNNMEFTRRE